MASEAKQPGDLHPLWDRFIRERDAAGLAGLYEEGATLVAPDGTVLNGRAQILAFYTDFVGSHDPSGTADHLEPIVAGDVAITSARMADGTLTCEVARRQPDGSWLWAIDKPYFTA